MRLTMVWFGLLVVLCTGLYAQDPPGAMPSKPNTPVRVCVATLVSEIKQASDTIALRDRLATYLRNGQVSKQGRVEIEVLKADSDETAAPELQERRCDFAIYTRAVAFRLKQQKRPDTDRSVVLRTTPAEPDQVPALQFTVVRVSSGIPVYIDRLFLSHPYEKDEDIWLLLRNEQERIESQLLKKLGQQSLQR